MKIFQKVLANDEGATAIEYGLIAALIAVALIGTLTSLGTSLDAKFVAVEDGLNAGSGSSGTSGGSSGGGTTPTPTTPTP